MTEEEARDKLREALKHVDFINLGAVLDSLASGLDWNRYDNSKWKPNFNKALEDKVWLTANMTAVNEALDFLYVTRPKRGAKNEE